MEIIVLLIAAIVFYIVGYKTHGRHISINLEVNSKEPTPAHLKKDGVDFVPAKLPILFGHHFASIAGAGPIVGPIIASGFGWFPVYLWLLIGAVFIGGVHDYTSIIASVRHEGKSIGEIIERYIGINGRRLFLAFAWSTLILVIAVFINIVADTFVRTPSAATSSLLFMLVAIVFGITSFKFRISTIKASFIAVPLLFFSVYIGNLFPLNINKETWQLIMFGYIFIASVTPVWLLLQPRDYLNSFLLYALMIGAFVGIFFASPNLHLPAFTSFSVKNLGYLFPVLFVTVACGAISGFHSLVSSGTTSKQLNKMVDAKRVGYGGMLLEGILAVLALFAVASLKPSEFDKFYELQLFVPAFAEGIGRFIESIPIVNISLDSARTFTSLAVSAFALTTLDTSTRLARFLFQESTDNPQENNTVTKNKKGSLFQNRFFATFITVLLGALLTFSGQSASLWPIFGSANQLLAAFALLSITTWLAHQKFPYFFTLIPTIFMFTVTSMALITLIYLNLFTERNYMLVAIAFSLLAISIIMCSKAYIQLRKVIIKNNKVQEEF
ncbi:MAG: carbon starvation protein A [Candidatus Caenarcaniphilales bacterium]|nr:carbon starvation protein A [Candidatus Caenarcaniphilales bacterium]